MHHATAKSSRVTDASTAHSADTPGTQPDRGLRIETIDPLIDARWPSFVSNSPEAGIFHHRDWLSLLRAQYRYQMSALCVSDADANIVAALPVAHVRSRLTGSRMVSVPFSDLCPVASRDGDQGAVALLLESVISRHERDGTEFEIRCEAGGIGHAGPRFLHHVVTLGPDVEAVTRGFGASTRRAISKARREGIEVTYEKSEAGLRTYYRMHLSTRHRQGVPTQPRRFFARFADLFSQDLGFVLIARDRGEPVAGAVMLTFKDTLTYKYGASFPSHLAKRPNNAIFAEAIRWGCEHGYARFDLGRTDLDNNGLRDFKRGWGASERTLGYTLLSRRTPKDSHALPQAVQSLITKTPAITGRLIGEALYRHFG
jgi:CelD/BcsL family acetyltransferase involved in cellulose biosynthesis